MKKTLEQISDELINKYADEKNFMLYFDGLDSGEYRFSSYQAASTLRKFAKEYASAYPSQPERVEGVIDADKISDAATEYYEINADAFRVGVRSPDAISTISFIDGIDWYKSELKKLLPAAPSAVDWNEVEAKILSLLFNGRHFKKTVGETTDDITAYLKNTLTAKIREMGKENIKSWYLWDSWKGEYQKGYYESVGDAITAKRRSANEEDLKIHEYEGDCFIKEVK